MRLKLSKEGKRDVYWMILRSEYRAWAEFPEEAADLSKDEVDLALRKYSRSWESLGWTAEVVP